MTSQLDKAQQSLLLFFEQSRDQVPPSWVMDHTTRIMKLVTENNELTEFFRLDQKTDEFRKERFSIDVEKYNNEIMPLLIDKLLSVIFSTNLGEGEQAKLKLFMAHKDKDPKFEDALNFANGVKPALRDRITFGKHLVQSLIPRELQLRIDSHYDLDETSHVAVPIEVKDIAKGPVRIVDARFESPIETILLTMIYYLRKG